MRRFAEMMRWAASRWNRFLYAPVDVRVCAILRIGYALLLLVCNLGWWEFAELWFSEKGILPYELSLDYRSDSGWSVLDIAPQSEALVHAIIALLTVHLVLLLIGFFSRIQAAFVFVYLVSLQHRNEIILDGEDTMFRMFGFFLLFLPIGGAWSIDRMRNTKPSRPWPKWPIRAIQAEWCMVLFAAGLYKAIGPAWQSGEALYTISRLDDFFGRFWTPAFLFDSPLLLRLATWSVVVLELLLPIAVWVPRFRFSMICLAVTFHLAIDYTMNLFLFQWIMMLGWLAFLEPRDLDWIGAKLTRRPNTGDSSSGRAPR